MYGQCKQFEWELTHPALVCAGPWKALAEYSLKYPGIDSPRNSETPTINRFLSEFMFVNCKKDNPTEPAKEYNMYMMKNQREMF